MPGTRLACASGKRIVPQSAGSAGSGGCPGPEKVMLTCREDLDKRAEEDERLEVHYVLSKAPESWVRLGSRVGGVQIRL